MSGHFEVASRKYARFHQESVGSQFLSLPPPHSYKSLSPLLVTAQNRQKTRVLGQELRAGVVANAAAFVFSKPISSEPAEFGLRHRASIQILYSAHCPAACCLKPLPAGENISDQVGIKVHRCQNRAQASIVGMRPTGDGRGATCAAGGLERMICSRQIEGFSKGFSEAARRRWSFGPSPASPFTQT
jgi:hypothetical protein